MTRLKHLLVAAFTLLNLSLTKAQAQSQDDVYQWLDVGRYRVLLIDTKFGNRLQTGVFANVGSSQDEPVHLAGRAHLFEHWFFAGSKKYPGAKDFDRIAESLGQSNGYTADNHTFYYIEHHPDVLDGAFDLLGSFFSHPMFSREGYTQEVKTVTDEAGRYQSDEIWAMHNVAAFYLYRPDDNRRRFSVGTKEQLAAMKPADLARLFYSNYKPENIVIIIAGNLEQRDTEGKLFVTPEKVRALVEGHFNFPSKEGLRQHLAGIWGEEFELDEKPGRERHINRPENGTFVPMGRMESRDGLHKIQLKFSNAGRTPATHREIAALELVSRYLSSSVPGGWVDMAKNKRWITNAAAWVSAVNNMTEVDVSFDIENTIESTQPLMITFFDYLGRLKRGEWDDSHMQATRNQIVQIVRLSTLSPSSTVALVAQALPQALNSGSKDLSVILDPASFYASITREEILAAAQNFFQLESLVLLEKKPNWQGGSETIFDGRRFERLTPQEYGKLMGDYNSALHGYDVRAHSNTYLLRDKPIPLNEMPIEGTELTAPIQNGRPDSEAGVTHFFAVQPHAGKAQKGMVGAQVIFVLPKDALTPLWVSAFNEAHKAEFSSLLGDGVNLNFELAPTGALSLSYTGPSNKLESAIQWALNGLQNLRPTRELFERERVALIDMLREPGQYSVHTGYNIASTILHPQRLQVGARIRQLEGLTYESFFDSRAVGPTRPIARADVQLSVVGDISHTAGEALFDRVSKLIPARLTPAERHGYIHERAAITTSSEVWSPSPKGIDPKDQVAVLSLEIPWEQEELWRDPHKMAMLGLLGQVLYNGVHARNRDQKGLGYIHAARVEPPTLPGQRGLIWFYGSSKNSQASLRMQAGWRWVVEHLIKGDLFTLIKMDFEGTKLGYQRELMLRGDTLYEEATRHRANVAKTLDGDMAWLQKKIEAVPKVTIADMQAIAREIFRPDTPLFAYYMSGDEPKFRCGATTARRVDP